MNNCPFNVGDIVSFDGRKWKIQAKNKLGDEWYLVLDLVDGDYQHGGIPCSMVTSVPTE